MAAGRHSLSLCIAVIGIPHGSCSRLRWLSISHQTLKLTQRQAQFYMVIIPTSLHLRRSLSQLASSDDSDSDDDDPDEDDYSEQKPINFTDIAARPSSVRTEVPPRKMLELQTTLLQPGRKRVSCNPLQKAIVEDDFEAFVHTLDLYEFAGAAIWPDSGAYDFAVALDRPEILDELIRRSGVGIPIPSDAAKDSGANSKKVSEERVYLGLKVGGKRRADIAN